MPRSRPRPAPAFLFLFVTLVIDMLGMGLLIPVLPELVAQLVHDRGETAQVYGLLISLYALMQLLFSPVLGALSDAYGRRPVLLLSALGTALATLLMGLTPAPPGLLLARALAGMTSASVSTANAYVADISTAGNRAKNFGMVGAAFGLGLIAGPALGGLLGQVDLRLPFFFAAGLAFLNFLYGLLVLPESLLPTRRRPFGLAHLNPLCGLGMLCCFPGVPGLAVTLMLAGLAVQFSTSTWVLYTTARFGWAPGANGASLAVSGFLMVLVQMLLLGRVIRRLGERRTVVLSLLLGALSYVLYGLSSDGWMLYATMLIGVMLGLGGPALQAMLAARVPADAQGRVQGALASLNSLGAIVGPLVSTALFARFTGPAAPVPLPGIAFFAGSAVLLLGLVVFRRSARPPQGFATPSATGEPS
ncbi:MFS transporter [Deinococcus metallilatus]|uniref:DHA1 family tetracycline resistance protein-like MFS transporter n=1 Tax=Deinococcus metallilatus TaxID=1211322 RepID=A0AAJ5F4K0_9DEIO|nr:TCR/Tet family MFS transporter [Deinococcus metallilatus]MBB5295073.1 DHA1 family tetracycline resistance protein-like MFS transporter [Deinococcus metallilatus]QBY08746.1 MFS transporter [Deinococcus metallilatus]RXJ10626.1 MFS transporter [Deinococcus metallilatus]TLK26597.1 TCR/Tet family MFS transporter [Deinococcus metallilatus]GMA14845.1 tetracycline resistance MFS efflux pump [Deinococcus metallilatus]